MKRVLAIAGIAIRNAVRSRIVIILLAMLMLAVIGIPLSVKGDGTLQGHVQILLRYSLGAAALILSLSTLWAGCAAVSLEIQHRRIHLVLSKPVHRWQIWLGDWLGLVMLNAALLAVCGAVTYGLFRWTTRDEALTSEQRAQLRAEILIARHRVQPLPVNVDDEVRREFDRLANQGQIPQDMPESQILEAIRQGVLRRTYSADPGGRHQWRFQLPDSGANGHPAVLRFRMSSSDLGSDRIRGLWRIARENAPMHYEYAEESAPLGIHSFEVPARALEGDGDLIVEFGNINEMPVTVLFDPEEGLQLLLHGTTFAMNYARALLALWIQLSFVAALGVTMGSLFSMPVASFIAICVVVLLQAAGYIESLAREPQILLSSGPTTPFWNAFLSVFFKIAHRVLGPLRGPDPLDLLAEGLLITNRWLATVFAVRLLLYAGGLALLSAWVLNRREMALPST